MFELPSEFEFRFSTLHFPCPNVRRILVQPQYRVTIVVGSWCGVTSPISKKTRKMSRLRVFDPPRLAPYHQGQVTLSPCPLCSAGVEPPHQRVSQLGLSMCAAALALSIAVQCHRIIRHCAAKIVTSIFMRCRHRWHHLQNGLHDCAWSVAGGKSDAAHWMYNNDDPIPLDAIVVVAYRRPVLPLPTQRRPPDKEGHVILIQCEKLLQ
jgi:hypothetical protein